MLYDIMNCNGITSLINSYEFENVSFTDIQTVKIFLP